MPNPKKPLAMALLHGNPGKRRLNTKEPQIDGKARCPQWLDPLAKREWQRITNEFAHLDLIKATDQAALAAYCVAYSRWRSAEAIIEREGQMVQEPIVTRSGNISGYRSRKHPAVAIAKDERASMLASGRLFGLNPSSRGSVHAPERADLPVDDDDDLDLYVQ